MTVNGDDVRTSSRRGRCWFTTSARRAVSPGRTRAATPLRWGLHHPPRRRSVKSCTLLAVAADGCDVTTIEGAARGTSCTRCRPRSRSITVASAATARRGWSWPRCRWPRGSRGQRGSGAEGPRGKPLSLHRLPQHRPVDPRRRTGDEGRAATGPDDPASFAYARADTATRRSPCWREHGEDAKLIAGGHSLLPHS